MIVKLECDISRFLPDTVAIDFDISEYLPERGEALALYNPTSRDFFISTTTDETYCGRITMSEIVGSFLEMYGAGEAAPLIEDLDAAIARIKSCTERLGVEL